MTDFVTEFKSALVAGNRSRLQLGELASKWFDTADFDYESLRTTLAGEGFDAPTAGTITKYRTVYQYWEQQNAVPRDRLEKIGVSKLYRLATYLRESSADPHAWLERAKNMTREALEAEINQQPLQEPWRQIRLPQSVFELVEQAAERLQLTPVQYQEQWATYSLRGNPEFLQGITDAMHGETNE